MHKKDNFRLVSSGIRGSSKDEMNSTNSATFENEGMEIMPFYWENCNILQQLHKSQVIFKI